MIPQLRPRDARLVLAALAGWVALCGSADLGEAGVWEDLPALEVARQEVGVAALDGVVYVIGGIFADRGTTGRVSRFDPELGAWEEVRPLPEGVELHHVGAAATAGQVWAIGGLTAAFRGVDSLYAFSPESGEWTERAPMPWQRGAMGVAELDGEIWVAGGQDGSPSFDTAARYDPVNDAWTELPPMPTARNHLAAVAADGLFYAISGRASGLRGAVEVFDIARGEWDSLEAIPTPRAGIAAALIEGRIYVFGGEGNRARPDGIFPQVEAWDIALSRWESLPDMPAPRHGVGAAVVDGAAWLPGGSPVDGFGVTGVVDRYRPCPDEAPFLRGDANRDQTIDLSDAVRILEVLFLGAEPFPCDDAADADDSGEHDISDALAVIGFLFLGGPPLPPPGPMESGPDPSADELGCSS